MIGSIIEKCTGCRACEKICPKNAIEMKENEKGFIYPHVNHEKCIECGLCFNRCPINSKEVENEKEAYASYALDNEIRKQSSSGGVFTLIAEYVINQNGIVFGAAFDSNFNVEHIYAQKKEELSALRKSKYTQSNTKNTYVEAKKFLDEGRLVYYSGTPCQIEGLKAYLNKEYENLITQDLICHGVPSPKVWQEYLKYKNKKIKEINFRSKENCTWQNFELSFKYDDETESRHHDKDTFMKLFLRDIILRDSCYNCSFKKENRISDITIADFWGIDEVLEGFNDQKGISLLILNNKKGKALINPILNQMVIKKVDFYEAIKENPSMTKSVKRHEKSEEVFEKLRQNKIFEVFDNMEKEEEGMNEENSDNNNL